MREKNYFTKSFTQSAQNGLRSFKTIHISCEKELPSVEENFNSYDLAFNQYELDKNNNV